MWISGLQKKPSKVPQSQNIRDGALVRGPCIKTWGAPLMLDGKVAGAQREYSNRGEVRTREPSLSFTTNVIYTQPAHNPIAIIKGSRCARKGDLEHKHKDIYDIHAGINKS